MVAVMITFHIFFAFYCPFCLQLILNQHLHECKRYLPSLIFQKYAISVCTTVSQCAHTSAFSKRGLNATRFCHRYLTYYISMSFIKLSFMIMFYHCLFLYVTSVTVTLNVTSVDSHKFFNAPWIDPQEKHL